MAIIELKNVTKIYRRSHLGRVKESVGVSDLSLSVKEGEVFGLLGLNGSGKTTTIKLLLGLHYPTKGSVHMAGEPMPSQSLLSRVGYLPEAAYINKYLTGREALTIFAKLARMPKAERTTAVPDLLEKVGMTKAADKKISDYSKGMVQRISMAQTLIHDPDIVIMDEPITGLDPLAIQEVRELILWLKDRGKTVFLSSHNISEVERVCDRLGILTNGKLACTMENKEWKKKPGHIEKVFASTVKRSDVMGTFSFHRKGA